MNKKNTAITEWNFENDLTDWNEPQLSWKQNNSQMKINVSDSIQEEEM